MATHSTGDLLFATSKTIQCYFTPEIAEIEGVIWAFQIAKREEITHVIVESDCLHLVQLLQKLSDAVSTLAVLTQKARLLDSKLTSCI